MLAVSGFEPATLQLEVHRPAVVTEHLQTQTNSWNKSRVSTPRVALNLRHLLQAALLLVSFVPRGLERLHASPHVPLEHLAVLTLLLPQRHEVTAVVGLILNSRGDTSS